MFQAQKETCHWPDAPIVNGKQRWMLAGDDIHATIVHTVDSGKMETLWHEPEEPSDVQFEALDTARQLLPLEPGMAVNIMLDIGVEEIIPLPF